MNHIKVKNVVIWMQIDIKLLARIYWTYCVYQFSL